MIKIRRSRFLLLAALVLVPALLIGLFFFLRQDAIGKAQQACNSFHITQQEPPQHIQAEFLLCAQAEQRTGQPECMDRNFLGVWYVSMEGSWLIQGPPNPDHSMSTPIPYAHCYALMDPFTGQVFEVGSH